MRRRAAKLLRELIVAAPGLCGCCLGVLCVSVANLRGAQPPAPTERLTFQDAVRRAIERNPTAAAAAAGIVRARGLLEQARAATLLQLTGNVTTTTLNRGVEFN